MELICQKIERVGMILGGESDGTTSFTTKAPDIPDFLRDPPRF
jgi:hypothetical protein